MQRYAKRIEMKHLSVLLYSLVLVIPVFSISTAAENEFRPLFDGKSLSGWRGDAAYWRVEGGAIVGDTKPGGIKQNTFLIADGNFDDFVLRVKFKLRNGASGIQFRSRRLSDDASHQFRVTGYQADIDYSGSTGEFYEEQGRSVLQRANSETVKRYVRKDRWNQLEIRMIGDVGEIRLNGQVTSRYTEKKTDVPRSGLIALQLQAGTEMEIAFKDILIREIKPHAWRQETVLISNRGGRAIVRSLKSGETLFENEDPQRAIEWGLKRARTTIVQEGKYLIHDRIDIPRPSVNLIVDRRAEIELREGTQHDSISFGSNRSPGYWQIVPLIYNQRHDNVNIFVFGKLVHSIWDNKTSGKQTFPIIFDGRNPSEACGIRGGKLLVTGTSTQSFWLVDCSEVDVPIVSLDTGLDAVLVLEGCEDCRLGLIANLAATPGGNSGETVDLNSRNKGISVDRLIGERSQEIVDCNESHATVHEVISIGTPRKLFGGDTGSGPRFTSRPSFRTRSLEVGRTTILDGADQVVLRQEIPDILDVLPVFDVKTTVELQDGDTHSFSKVARIDIR